MTHEQLAAKAFTVYRNSNVFTQNISDSELVKNISKMYDAVLIDFINRYS